MAESEKTECPHCDLENIYWSLMKLILELRQERAQPHIEDGTLVFTLPERGTIRAKFYGKIVD